MDPLDFKPIDNEEKREILEFIRSSLQEKDPCKLRKALLSLEWLERPLGLVAPLIELVRSGGDEMALVALEGLSRLESVQAEKGLIEYMEELLKKKLDKVELRQESIRTLGKVGAHKSVKLLAEIIRGKYSFAMPEDQMAAVEGLVSLGVRGQRGVSDVMEKLHAESGGELKESLAMGLRELNVSGWEEKGYLTIEGKFEGSGDEG